MRVYGYGTASFYTYLILMLAYTETSQDILGKHYDDQRQKTDKTTPSYASTIRLYSKSSGKFVQVMRRAVNASATEGSDAALLITETDTFGKIRIRHYKSNYYICMNVKGDIIGLNEKKGRHMKRCLFRIVRTQDGYVQFISDKYGKKKKVSRYLAFRHTGEPKLFTKVLVANQRATKFLKVEVKNKKKRHAKRNIRRRRISHEFLSHEKRKHKKRQGSKLCLRYLRCMHKKWKSKNRGQRITVRCSRIRRRRFCKCRCAKQ